MNLKLQPESEPRSESEPILHPRLRLHRQFASRHLAAARDLIVYLPPGYEEQRGRKYPVLYMQDGQNLFDGRTSFIKGRTWQMREQADEVIEAGEVEPLVIVGIYNTGERRVAEYTHDYPTGQDPSVEIHKKHDSQPDGGEADRYGRLLIEELMPWVASRYRVRTDREATGLGGASLGGLVTLFLGLRYAQCFGRLAVMSPSVWWNQKSILGYVNERAPEIREKPRLWLDVGGQEGRQTVRDAEALARRLKTNGWVAGETLHFERFADGTHDEASWARRVKPILRFLFPA